MHSLEPELRELRAAGADAAAVDRALALERGTPFSVRRELLVALYAAVLAITAGAGLLLRAHLERIGPLALLAALLVAATACYGVALRQRLLGRERSIGLDYVLLLGALLASAAVGYAELQFQWLGAGWARHLLLLAAWHAATAWLLDSRLVLSVALVAFAGWLGIEAGLPALFDGPQALARGGWRALGCAALYLGLATWLRRAGRRPTFPEVLEQFAANLAFWGVLALCGEAGTRGAGVLLLALLAPAVAWIGMRQRRESLVLYGVGYGTLGALLLQAQWNGGRWIPELGLLTIVAAVLVLLRLRARLRACAR